MTESSFGYRTGAMEIVADTNLLSKNAIVTGGYSGIGLETTRALASAGANVTIACRDIDRAKSVVAKLNESLGSVKVKAMQLDLSSLESIQSFSKSWLSENNELHILINNAAIMACPESKTNDGFEAQFGTNHLGHFSLTTQLLPALKRAGSSRVVCLSSTGHFLSPVVFDDINFEARPYDPWSSYGQSKTACALMARAIQDRYADLGIEAFSVHPGGIMTTLQRHMSEEDITSRGWVDKEGNVNERFKTVEQGASTSVWAATAESLKGSGGVYLEDCGIATEHHEIPESRTGVMAYAIDSDNADRLWETSLQMIERAKTIEN
ncbi:MAG: NAD(P)-dependent dehydrogenase (short-subunit alcohol dehydrogenase family) [Candidatus Azotimanducaceae bacterium]|jgi:NAD(P)-dependent dehydrogenase (short-subunit alcohol dehydrogenase family)